MKIGISSCLLGVNCKYNGSNNFNELISKVAQKYNIVPMCPEYDSLLPTPRPPSEIKILIDGTKKVYSKTGEDLTQKFKMGAEATLTKVLSNEIELVIMKQRSPSCGVGKIYDGTFSGKVIDGNGVAAQLLIDNGIKVITEENIEELENLLDKNND